MSITYASQAELDESSKRQFWEDIDEIVQRIHIREKNFIGSDINGHAGTSHYDLYLYQYAKDYNPRLYL